MKPPQALSTLLVWSCILFPSGAIRAESTISADAAERFAYGANIGPIDFRSGADSPGEGAEVTDFFLGGFVYGANIGWIDLGDSGPSDGVSYSNTAADDFGVNHDGEGNLSGLAYGANVGWINFGNPAPTWDPPPIIDLKTGEFSGYAYGANIGWIDIGEIGYANVVTASINPGPDTDGDGIADAWEYERVIAAGLATGNLATDLSFLSAAGDADADTVDDVAEFVADSDPFDVEDYLRFLSGTRDLALETIALEWRSSPRRIYDLYWSNDLAIFTLDAGQRDIMPSSGSSTTHTAPSPAADERRFWEVLARRPLSP